MEPEEILDLPFAEALKAWLEDYEIHIAPKTLKDYRWDAKALSAWTPFTLLKLKDVKADHMHQYQKKRLLTDHLERLSVNHELDFLARVRRNLKLPVSGYKRLKVPFTPKGRALSEPERERILTLARENPDWMGAYLYLALSLNIGCGPKECFTIRLKDIHLDDEIPHVCVGLSRKTGDGAKNDFRPRRCALNRQSLAAVEQALERAKSLGAREPEDFLFPFRVSATEGYDPTRHMVSIKTAWRSLRKAAGLPKLRQYDMRHHCITVMLEHPLISDQTIEDTVGHIDPRTKRFYSHIRLAARQRAAALIGGDPLPDLGGSGSGPAGNDAAHQNHNHNHNEANHHSNQANEPGGNQVSNGGRKPPVSISPVDRVAKAIRKTDMQTAATRELIEVLGGLSAILKQKKA